MAALLSSCGHKKVRAKAPAPAPAITEATQLPTPPIENPADPVKTPSNFGLDAPAMFTEVGMASWYGPPYHNRKAANGEVFDMNRLSAAHRTLPLNSIVRVTNLKTNHSVVLRITDRGPFVGDRIIDLSAAAAKAVDVWRPGTAKVQIDVLLTPRPMSEGGRWCVQIGAINDEEVATELKQELAMRYVSSKVQQFKSPVGDYWIRVRVPNDNKLSAETIADENTTPQGNIFLVRLD